MCTHDSLFSEHGPRARNSFSAIFRLGTHGVKYERTCTIAHVLKPLNFHIRNWMFISRDVLDCQDFEEKILVLLSKFEIFKKISLSLLDWMRFCKQILFSRIKIFLSVADNFSFLGQKKNKTEIGMWMVVGEFLFLVTKSLKSRCLDLLLNHEIWFQNFSFSSRNWRKLQISRFLLHKF